jgi:hypothetical protein
MSYANGPRIVTDGLVCCLDAANRKSYPGSGNVWTDLSGNGYNASLSNITFSNNALVFNGSTSTALISDIVPPRSLHTIIIWAKSSVALSNTTSGSARKTMFKNNTSWNPGLWMQGGVIRPHMPPEYRDKLITYRTFTDWFSVGQIWNGSDVYTIDNSSVTLDTLRSSTYGQANVTGMTIGYESGYTAYTWNGSISLFYIYDRVLSANEVQQNYNALKGRYGLT